MAVPRNASVARMTYAEHLEAEVSSEVRHEFLNGDVWAMAGGSPCRVSQTEALLEIYRRIEGDRWELVEARSGDRPTLLSPNRGGVPSNGVAIDVHAVYEGLA